MKMIFKLFSSWRYKVKYFLNQYLNKLKTESNVVSPLELMPSIVADYLSATGFEILWQGGIDNIVASKSLFRAALHFAPDLPSAHAGLARVLRCQQQPGIALQHAEKAEVGNPADYHNLKIKAFILRDLGRLSEAAETLRLVVRLEPEGEAQEITDLTEKIISAAVQRRYEEGLIEILRALPKLDSDSWEPYRLGSWLLKHKGDHNASQFLAVGRFTKGVGRQIFSEKKISIISIEDLCNFGVVVADKHLNLNEKSINLVKNLKGPRFELSEQRNVRITTLNGASCVSSKFGTAVLVGNQLIEELSQNDALMILQRGVPDPQEVSGRVLNVVFPWGEGFFHFMMEVLPAICAAWEALGKSTFDKYLLRTRVSYQLKILSQLGINEDQLIFSDQSSTILPEELVVISNFVPLPPFYEAQHWACHYVCNALKGMGDQGRPGPKRVLISRGEGTNGRTIVNESQLALLLGKHGFITVHPERLDFCDQVSLYQGAEIVIAPAGGALVNLIFCKPGTKVLVFFQPRSTWRVYDSIAEIIGIEMYKIFGDAVEPELINDPDWMRIDDNVDFEVNLSEVEKNLALMLNNENRLSS